VEQPFLTGLGLAGPAGLNAYIPLLVLALSDRLTERVNLGSPYDFLSSNAGIAIILLLLTVELFVDKIPGVDHFNDMVQTVVRPASGGLIMMSTSTSGGSTNAVVAMVLGLLVAGGVHAAKTIGRPAVTVSTGGIGNPIISMAEDAIALIASILAIVLPILGFAIFVVLGLGLVVIFRSVRDRLGRRRPTAASPAQPPASTPKPPA
jgi:hypothetical protein